VNHKSNLQGIPFRKPDSRQTRSPQRAVSRSQIKDLGILHGGLFIDCASAPSSAAIVSCDSNNSRKQKQKDR
jgi:hypothetical protein